MYRLYLIEVKNMEYIILKSEKLNMEWRKLKKNYKVTMTKSQHIFDKLLTLEQPNLESS